MHGEFLRKCAACGAFGLNCAGKPAKMGQAVFGILFFEFFVNRLT